MHPHNDRTDLRLKLYENGFTPLANRRKMCLLKDWSRLEITPDLIRSKEWARSKAFPDTGIRCGDVVALDWDIDDGVLLNDLLDAAVEQGVVAESPFVRIGRPPRELWVYRTRDKIGKRTTGHFAPPDAASDFGGYAVEVLGAGCQFAAYGQRDDENWYDWPEASLADHVYMDLPPISMAEVEALVAFAAGFFEERGLKRLSPGGGTDAGYTHAYDLTEDLSFEVKDVGHLSLAELTAALEADPERVLRVTVDALRPTSGSWAGMASLVGGVLCVSDHGTYTSHFPVSYDLERSMSALGQNLASLMKQPKPREPARGKLPDLDLDAQAEFDTNYRVMLDNFVYVADTDVVIDLRHPTVTMKIPHLHNRLSNFTTEETGPKGGKIVTRLSDLWMRNPNRMMVRGFGLRPDREWPIFEENGDRHLNTFRDHVLPEDGDAAMGFDFLERLLPIAEERQYFTRWLGNKLLHPEQRGPAIFMVAHETYGTGRGSLISIIRSMFAPGLVRNIDFKTLSGQTYQSQYNEWLADSLIVAVDEAQEATQTMSRWQTRLNAYEHLKGIIDPAVNDLDVKRKGLANGPGRTYASIMVMTNHMDSLVLPRNDRRIAVFENGSPQSEAYYAALHAWRAVPGNIGAFVAALKDVDMGDYSAFATPPLTKAKVEMAEAGESEIDRQFKRVTARWANTVLVKEQVLLALEDEIADSNVEMPDDWRRTAERLFTRATRSLPDSLPDRIRIEGKQRSVRMLGRPAPAVLQSAQTVLDEVLRNGPVSRPMRANNVVSFPSR